MNPNAAATVELDLRGLAGSSMTASGMTLKGGSIDAHNTFEQPEAVKPEPFADFELLNGKLTITLPPMSVTALELSSN